MGQNLVPLVPDTSRPPPFLNVEYWSCMLHTVYDSGKAEAILHDLVQGVRIGRSEAGSTIISPNWPSAFEHRAEVTKIIQDDLARGRLYGPFRSPPYQAFIVSPMGAFLKRDSTTKIRLIHDLSYPAAGSVNSAIDPDQFSLKYASIDDAVEHCNQFPHSPPFMSKLDLKDAFKFIYINPCDWHLMGLSWPDGAGCTQYYFSKVLSFGLRSAPALFDQFASALHLFMVHNGAPPTCVRYVDDFLLVAPSAPACQDGLAIMLDTCRLAGFQVQPSKVTAPDTMVKFLGIKIDTVARTLSIDEERLIEVKQLVAQCLVQRVITKRQLLSVIGKLAFAARVVRVGRAFIGRLIDAAKSVKYLHYKVRLNIAAMEDLCWWRDCVEEFNGVSMLPPPWDDDTAVSVYSDASNLAMGAYFHPDWFSTPYVGSLARATSNSINWRELFAALAALLTWAPRLAGKNVYFHIDNQSVVFALKKHYSPVTSMMALIRTWCLTIVRYNINPRPIYISTTDNVDADDLSRLAANSFRERNPHASPTPTWPTLTPF